jgi:hypothetical protein
MVSHDAVGRFIAHSLDNHTSPVEATTHANLTHNKKRNRVSYAINSKKDNNRTTP